MRPEKVPVTITNQDGEKIVIGSAELLGVTKDGDIRMEVSIEDENFKAQFAPFSVDDLSIYTPKEKEEREENPLSQNQ